MNSSEAQPREAAPNPSSIPGTSSIIAHPWFPKMIGLWFAALFGLCSLALAPELIERVVTALGIDRIVPAAAPPLGQTARLLLALGMAGVGEIAGLIIGARLAASRNPQRVRQRGIKATAAEADSIEDTPHLRGRDRHPDAPARQPLSATSDLGDDLSGIDNALRRRALAGETEHEPRPFVEFAPLPGDQWPPVTERASEAEAPVVPEAAPACAFAEAGDEAGDEVGNVFDLGAFNESPQAQAEAPSVSFVASLLAPPAPVVEPVAMPEPSSRSAAEAAHRPVPPAPAAGIATASLEALGVVQLSERLALALQARREPRAQVPVAAVATAPVVFAAVADLVEEPLATVPVEDRPVVEPITAHEEPLVSALKPASFAPAPFAPPASFAPIAVHDADKDDDIPALARSLSMPRFASNGLAAPAVTPEPVAPELERELEILARRAPKPTVEPDAPSEDPESPIPAFEPEGMTAADDGEDLEELADDVLEQGYSSLLAMGSGFQRPEAVRIVEPQSDEIEPVAIFPGQGARFAGEPSGPPLARLNFSANAPVALPGMAPAASDAEETDRAVRAALASLQRISGAR